MLYLPQVRSQHPFELSPLVIPPQSCYQSACWGNSVLPISSSPQRLLQTPTMGEQGGYLPDSAHAHASKWGEGDRGRLRAVLSCCHDLGKGLFTSLWSSQGHEAQSQRDAEAGTEGERRRGADRKRELPPRTHCSEETDLSK